MDVGCACWIEYDSPEDLAELDLAALPQPVLHIGAGSNLLFTGDFPGTVLHSDIKYYKVAASAEEEVLVEVGAGVVFDDFCAWASDNELWGAENLSGIPGEVGAAAVQNIGAYGAEVKDIVAQVKCFDWERKRIETLSVAQCGYGYRESAFKHAPLKGRLAVVGVLFRLSKAPRPRLEYGPLKTAFAGGAPAHPAEVRQEILRIRNGKLPDPAVLGSAGSFFKNPIVDSAAFADVVAIAPHFDLPGGQVKIPAAWLIEQCGLKGERLGEAAVYERQPLVIVNATGTARPEDILALERKVIDSVRQKFGIELSPEVEHI
jgi:UDP-N-acetylmuramate dehydrogenase